MARIAKSLDTLRAQINAAYPNRSKKSDGWIGDAAHAARKSDHNPNSAGVVQALDITHDPRNGPDAGKLAEFLIITRDSRIKYIISNGKIAHSSDWKWVKYTGANAHTQHCHISVSNDPGLYDDDRPWHIDAQEHPKPVSVPAKNTFDEALKRLLEDEGGYTNDPDDAGGPTNFGITIHDFRRYVRADGTANDVKHMSVDTAKTIYREKYWKVMWCDDLPAGVDYAVFDYGVNSGIGRAIPALQRLVGTSQDGVIGPITLAAVRARDATKLINQICDQRMAYLRAHTKFWKFGKGWTARVGRVRAAALNMAENSVPVPRPPSTFARLTSWWKGTTA